MNMLFVFDRAKENVDSLPPALMKEFCFVSHYKCDFIHQTVGALFVSVSSESNAEQATVVRQKQLCNHVAVFCFWFCFVLIHFTLLGPVYFFVVAVALMNMHLARFKSNQFYLHRIFILVCVIDFTICKTYDIIYSYTFGLDKTLHTQKDI